MTLEGHSHFVYSVCWSPDVVQGRDGVERRDGARLRRGHGVVPRDPEGALQASELGVLEPRRVQGRGLGWLFRRMRTTRCASGPFRTVPSSPPTPPAARRISTRPPGPGRRDPHAPGPRLGIRRHRCLGPGQAHGLGARRGRQERHHRQPRGPRLRVRQGEHRGGLHGGVLQRAAQRRAELESSGSQDAGEDLRARRRAHEHGRRPGGAREPRGARQAAPARLRRKEDTEERSRAALARVSATASPRGGRSASRVCRAKHAARRTTTTTRTRTRIRKTPAAPSSTPAAPSSPPAAPAAAAESKSSTPMTSTVSPPEPLPVEQPDDEEVARMVADIQLFQAEDRAIAPPPPPPPPPPWDVQRLGLRRAASLLRAAPRVPDPARGLPRGVPHAQPAGPGPGRRVRALPSRLAPVHRAPRPRRARGARRDPQGHARPRDGNVRHAGHPRQARDHHERLQRLLGSEHADAEPRRPAELFRRGQPPGRRGPDGARAPRDGGPRGARRPAQVHRARLRSPGARARQLRVPPRPAPPCASRTWSASP